MNLVTPGNIEMIRHNLKVHRGLYPHLKRYFDMIDQCSEINEEEANNKIYTYHLNNKTMPSL
jgi:hypothetical protein